MKKKKKMKMIEKESLTGFLLTNMVFLTFKTLGGANKRRSITIKK